MLDELPLIAPGIHLISGAHQDGLRRVASEPDCPCLLVKILSMKLWHALMDRRTCMLDYELLHDGGSRAHVAKYLRFIH